MQAKEQRQAKEAQIAKAQMDAARRGGVSWGMAEEAALEDNPEDVSEGEALLSQGNAATQDGSTTQDLG